MATSRKLSDEELIDKYVEPDPNTGRRARARIREGEGGAPVWALIAFLLPDESNAVQVARDYGISDEAMDAARATGATRSTSTPGTCFTASHEGLVLPGR